MALLPRDLKEFLAPFKALTNKNALSNLYKVLLLTPDLVRGCSSYGVAEVRMNIGVDADCYVDAATFMAVIDSLPAEEELVLAPDDGVLLWTCGNAKGRLALVQIEEMPTINRRPKPSAAKAPEGLAEALRLGALSCDSMSLGSAGMHGVVIDNRGTALRVTSSDNITIAACDLPGAALAGVPEVMTISPEAAALLALVMKAEGFLECDATSIFYRDDGIKVLVKQVAPLKHDLTGVMGNFAGETIKAAIPRDRIAAFIKRVGAMAESRKNTTVTLDAADGQLGLAFADNVAMSDEYFLAEGLALPEALSIKLDAMRLARALAHVDSVVLDHMGKGALIFRGAKPDFTYMVAGRK